MKDRDLHQVPRKAPAGLSLYVCMWYMCTLYMHVYICEFMYVYMCVYICLKVPSCTLPPNPYPTPLSISPACTPTPHDPTTTSSKLYPYLHSLPSTQSTNPPPTLISIHSCTPTPSLKPYQLPTNPALLHLKPLIPMSYHLTCHLQHSNPTTLHPHSYPLHPTLSSTLI